MIEEKDKKLAELLGITLYAETKQTITTNLGTLVNIDVVSCFGYLERIITDCDSLLRNMILDIPENGEEVLNKMLERRNVYIQQIMKQQNEGVGVCRKKALEQSEAKGGVQ